MKKIVTFVVGLSVFIPVFVGAQGFGQVATQAPINIAPPTDFITTILNVVNFVLGLIGITALSFFIFGVYRYITSGSNEDQLAESKGTMVSSSVGLLIMAVAAALINFLVGIVTGKIGGGSSF